MAGMIRPGALFAVLLLAFAGTVCAQAPIVSETDSVSQIEESKKEFSPVKLAIVGGGLAAFYTTSWAIFSQYWWHEKDGFRWEALAHDVGDSSYAMNLDKLGHFWGGAFAAEVFFDAYHWTGMGERNAYIAAGATTTLTQLIVEFKDGFSPYGFSVFDAMAGSLGGFWPLAKRYFSPLKYVDYKWSYWINDHSYWDADLNDEALFTDDYINQTHWLSFKIGEMWEPWPRWLALAVGCGVNGMRFVPGSHNPPQYEFYIAPDLDLKALFAPQKYWLQRVVTLLDYVKWPSPALRVRPKPALIWLFPIDVVRVSF
jgi:hypothetical protein